MKTGKRPPFRPNMELALGSYRMRNGHTADILASETLTYTSCSVVLWHGRCVECATPLSWIGVARGAYAARGKHPFDLVEVLALARPGKRAA